jgi:hypothetical protein
MTGAGGAPGESPHSLYQYPLMHLLIWKGLQSYISKPSQLLYSPGIVYNLNYQPSHYSKLIFSFIVALQISPSPPPSLCSMLVRVSEL